MKTKLLKKVRKRYTITMYTKLDNPNFYLYGHSVPVWRVEDNENDYVSSKIANTYDEAHAMLIQMIRSAYKSKMNRQNRQTEETVWYKP